MPSAFDSLFAAAGFPDLIEHFGEPVTYVPRVGDSRSISAIITREPSRPLEINSKVIMPKFLVRVYNSSALGIADTELNTGGDKLTLPKLPGSTPDDHAIVARVSADSGVLELAVI